MNDIWQGITCGGTGAVSVTGRGSDGFERCEDCNPISHIAITHIAGQVGDES